MLDSDTANCSRHSGMFGGFFNENKQGPAYDTTEQLQGDIVLNVKANAGDRDELISGTRTIADMVIWGSTAGYSGAESDTGEPELVPGTLSATRMTLGKLTGTYDGGNGEPAGGTGFANTSSGMPAALTSSILAQNHSLGVADWVVSDYNAFFGNGADYGGSFHEPAAGAHDRTGDVAASLRYLPRIEPGSPLKTAGKDGGQIGAEILFQIGEAGTLWDEPGWDAVTAQPLWPFPNEDQIRRDMAAYTGPGAPGARGFATGNSRDGTPQTLTKYIWEYLGNQIPDEIYGFGIASSSLPQGVVGTAYAATLIGHGGTPPYAWTASGLPSGLALDPASGAISGTPTAPGTSTVTVTLTDSAKPSQHASRQLSLAVAEAHGGGGGGGGAKGGCEAGAGGWASLLAMLALLMAVLRRVEP